MNYYDLFFPFLWLALSVVLVHLPKIYHQHRPLLAATCPVFVALLVVFVAKTYASL
jgi:hypothetical protein